MPLPGRARRRPGAGGRLPARAGAPVPGGRAATPSPPSGSPASTPPPSGADPGAIALGGDSSGANLAAVTAHLAVRAGEPAPAFLLLFYPPSDAVHRTPSRDLFAAGFMLTEADIVWFSDHYMPPGVDRGDPRASILLADDLSGMPPTYLMTAGFDPIRDEGELFAERLAASGVPVVLRRQPDLVHGFVNMIGLAAAVPGGGRRGGRRVARRAGLTDVLLAATRDPRADRSRLHGHGRSERLCALGETRTHTVRDLNPLPLPIGIRGPAPAAGAATILDGPGRRS